MKTLTNKSTKFHNIKVKLYPNNLQHVKGAFLARTSNEETLSIEQVCKAIKERGNFTGNYEDLVNHVKLFYDEAAYQLCDGFAINTGYYTVYPNIGGSFNSAFDTFKHNENPITFRLKPGALLRLMAKHINVDITGFADEPYIKQFYCSEDNSINNSYIPGSFFCITGYKIKIAGDDPDCGVYFVPVEDPSKAVKLNRIAVNTNAKIIGMSPETGFLRNKIVIKTQYTGSGNVLLKRAKAITSKFIVEEKQCPV